MELDVLGESSDGPGPELIGILATILVGAVFASVDAALLAFGQARARATSEANDASGKAAARYLSERHRIHARMLAGQVLSLSAAAVVASRLAFAYDGIWAGVGAAVGVAWLYATVVGVARTLVAGRAGRLALPLLRIMRPLELCMLPFAWPLAWASRHTSRFLPPEPDDDPGRVTELEVEHLIEEAEERGAIAEEHAELIRSVLEFTDTVAREVMVPRTRMAAIEINTPLEEVAKLVVDSGHSRYPVYRERVDYVEGILYAKDLFRFIRDAEDAGGDLSNIIRKPVFFAVESQKISSLLRQMQAKRIHLAVVVDEFGGTSGMVTLEDIIEEIVGDIRDEHDLEELPLREIAPGRFVVNAEVSVYDLARQVDLELPEAAGDYDSLGGMIVDLAGGVPAEGAVLRLGKHELTVREADKRHVKRVELAVCSSMGSVAE